MPVCISTAVARTLIGVNRLCVQDLVFFGIINIRIFEAHRAAQSIQQLTVYIPLLFYRSGVPGYNWPGYKRESEVVVNFAL